MKRGGAGKGNWGTVEDEGNNAEEEPTEAEEHENAGEAERPQEVAPPGAEVQENTAVCSSVLC
jgi:hypothetical protein